jgi:hypothetical protein
MLGHWHVLLVLRSRYDYLGLPLLHLVLLLRIAMVHLHLRRRVLLLVLLRVLRRLPILLVPILWLLWRILGIRAVVVAVLLVVPRIHGRCMQSSVVQSPGIVVCHDIVKCLWVVKDVQSCDAQRQSRLDSRSHMPDWPMTRAFVN